MNRPPRSGRMKAVTGRISPVSDEANRSSLIEIVQEKKAVTGFGIVKGFRVLRFLADEPSAGAIEGANGQDISWRRRASFR